MNEQTKQQIEVKKQHLVDTDWVNSKWADIEIKAKLEGKTDAEIQELRIAYYEQYKEIYSDRECTRNEIDELQMKGEE